MKNDIYECELCHRQVQVTGAGEVLDDACGCDAALEPTAETKARYEDCEDCIAEGTGRCICYDDRPAPTRAEEIASLRAALADPDGHPEDRAAWRHELSILTRPDSWS
jgi:hypothetical protein